MISVRAMQNNKNSYDLQRRINCNKNFLLHFGRFFIKDTSHLTSGLISLATASMSTNMVGVPYTEVHFSYTTSYSSYSFRNHSSKKSFRRYLFFIKSNVVDPGYNKNWIPTGIRQLSGSRSVLWIRIRIHTGNNRINCRQTV